MMKQFLTGILAVILCMPLIAQEPSREKGFESITKDIVEAQLEFLSSDWMEGRETGKRGQYLAADYIANLFQIYGLQPAGDSKTIRIPGPTRMSPSKYKKVNSYFQDFNLVEYKAGKHQTFMIKGKKKSALNYRFKHKTDFSLSPANISQEIESDILFVGYGFRNEKAGYDDFEGLDIQGKVIMILDGHPGQGFPESEAHKKLAPKTMIERMTVGYQQMIALMQMRPAAVIKVNMKKDAAGDFVDNVPFRYHRDYYEGFEPLKTREHQYGFIGDEMDPGHTTITLSNRALNMLLEDSGLDLKVYAKQVAETAKPASRVLKNKRVYIKTDVESRIIQTRNVLAKIEGEEKDKVIVVGGHYDHLGMRKGYIYNGADDNASGTVGVMTIAKALVEAGIQPKYTMVFAAWTGEEMGLLGSRFYVDSVKEDVLFYLNYDMISRDDPGMEDSTKCRLLFTSTCPGLKENTEKNLSEKNIELDMEYIGLPRPLGGSDHAAFVFNNIPIIYYISGMPKEYHTPIDHIEMVNYDKMMSIIKMGYLNMWDIGMGEVDLAKKQTE